LEGIDLDLDDIDALMAEANTEVETEVEIKDTTTSDEIDMDELAGLEDIDLDALAETPEAESNQETSEVMADEDVILESTTVDSIDELAMDVNDEIS